MRLRRERTERNEIDACPFKKEVEKPKPFLRGRPSSGSASTLVKKFEE